MAAIHGTRFMLTAVLAVGLAHVAQAQAQNQSYPNRQIRMILPFAAGGAGDTFARPLVQALQQSLGQPVVIENIVGAAAIIGTQVAARAPADGYTVLMVSNALAIGDSAKNATWSITPLLSVAAPSGVPMK